MAHFAKLFTRGEHQVLVTKGYNDDDEAVLTFETKTRRSGHSLKIAVVIKEGPNAQTLDEALQHGFDVVDEERAFGIVNGSPGIDL